MQELSVDENSAVRPRSLVEMHLEKQHAKGKERHTEKGSNHRHIWDRQKDMGMYARKGGGVNHPGISNRFESSSTSKYL